MSSLVPVQDEHPRPYDQHDQPRGERMSRQEAEEISDKIIFSVIECRHYLLAAFEGSAHIALGYASFEEYCASRLGMDRPASDLRRMRMWARVERDAVLSALPDRAQPGNTQVPSLQSITRGCLSRNVAMELAKLPSESRRQAYEEAISLGATGKRALQCVKHIVTRRLNEAAGIRPEIAAPREQKQIAPPAPATASTVASPPVEDTELIMAPPVAVAEQLPFGRWREAVCQTLSMIDSRIPAGDVSDRRAISTSLLQLARWVAEGR
jgi:hypothetical protein